MVEKIMGKRNRKDRFLTNRHYHVETFSKRTLDKQLVNVRKNIRGKMENSVVIDDYVLWKDLSACDPLSDLCQFIKENDPYKHDNTTNYRQPNYQPTKAYRPLTKKSHNIVMRLGKLCQNILVSSVIRFKNRI